MDISWQLALSLEGHWAWEGRGGGLVHCAGMIWGVQDANISYLG